MNISTPKLIILDRDGVINQDYPTGCTRVEDFKILPQVIEALCLINKHTILTAIATNQALVGRGEISSETLNAIHAHMHHLFEQNDVTIGPIYVCTDTDIAPHYRRKPAPGMLLEAMEDLKCLPSETVFIGDALRDVEAAHNAGCTAVLVKTGKGTETYASLPAHFQNILVYDTLLEAVQNLLKIK